MTDPSSLKQFLHLARDRALRGDSLIPPDSEILDLPGFSSPDSRHFLNNLQDYGETYLEVGIHHGSTFLSALHGRLDRKKAYAVDNWCEFGNHLDEFLARLERLAGLSEVGPGTPVEYFEHDCFTLDLSLIEGPVDIYFYDGNHDKESHRKALTHYYPVLADRFLFIVDDWNWRKVRSGTRQALRRLKLEVEAEVEIRTPGDQSPSFWNGYYAAFLRKG
jgi:hypothetical protein